MIIDQFEMPGANASCHALQRPIVERRFSGLGAGGLTPIRIIRVPNKSGFRFSDKFTIIRNRLFPRAEQCSPGRLVISIRVD